MRTAGLCEYGDQTQSIVQAGRFECPCAAPVVCRAIGPPELSMDAGQGANRVMQPRFDFNRRLVVGHRFCEVAGLPQAVAEVSVETGRAARQADCATIERFSRFVLACQRRKQARVLP